MALAITREGIDEALSHFHYKDKKTLKSRFIRLVRRYYEDERAIETLTRIDTDELITLLWDTGDDPIIIKNRRKNFTSIKSAINKELEELYIKGENPEGVIIGPGNTFIMSDEARNDALEAFVKRPKEDEAALLQQVKDVLKVLGETLAESSSFHNGGPENDPGGLQEIRELIRELSARAGLGEPVVPLDEVLEEIDAGDREEEDELSPDEDLEEVDAGEIEEILEEVDGEEDPGDLPGEVDELSPDEDLEEVDAGEIEEILEEVDGEEAPEDFPGEVEGLSPDEDLEEVYAGEIEEILEEVDGEEDPGDLPGEVEGLSPDEELEEVDAADSEEVLEEVDIAGAGDEVEEVAPDEELEVVDEDDIAELFEEVVEDDGEAGPGDLPGEEGEDIPPDEELEEVGEDDLEEVLEEVDDAGSDGDVSYDVDSGESAGTEDEEEGLRLLAEQFNESLAAMDRFYNQYILIPEGNFPIGSGLSAKSVNIERVVHLPPFYLGKFPVTNVLFEIFIEETGYKTTAERVGYGTVFHGRHRAQKKAVNDSMTTFSCNASLSVKVVKGACWYQPFGPGSTLYGKRNHPVVQISLEDALAFAAWTGKRLPSEEEWEAAARTSDGRFFPWGDEWLDDACNTEGNLIGDTTTVDRYREFENRYGIADMLGNVLEWTITRSKEPDPQNGGTEGLYIAKGGSFISGNGIALSDRTVLHPHYHSNILGCRCVAY